MNIKPYTPGVHSYVIAHSTRGHTRVTLTVCSPAAIVEAAFTGVDVYTRVAWVSLGEVTATEPAIYSGRYTFYTEAQAVAYMSGLKDLSPPFNTATPVPYYLYLLGVQDCAAGCIVLKGGEA